LRLSFFTLIHIKVSAVTAAQFATTSSTAPRWTTTPPAGSWHQCRKQVPEFRRKRRQDRRRQSRKHNTRHQMVFLKFAGRGRA